MSAGQKLSYGQLAPGETTTGYVVTEVPTNASIMELKMALTYGNASWALQQALARLRDALDPRHSAKQSPFARRLALSV